MSVKALLSALGFVLLVGTFAFSLWAEWGPYSWFVAAQVALMDSYSEKLTFFLTFILFLIPAALLLIVFLPGGRAAKAVGLGVPVLLILVHLVATFFFIYSGGAQIESPAFESGITQASFVPQNITLDTRTLPALDLTQSFAIKAPYAPDDSAEIYVPFASSSPPSPGTLVVLKSTPAGIKALAQPGSLKGVLKKAPLPSLVRRSWPQAQSIFAIIIEEKATVRGLWIPAAVIYVIAIISIIAGIFKSRHAKSAQQPTQI